MFEELVPLLLLFDIVFSNQSFRLFAATFFGLCDLRLILVQHLGALSELLLLLGVEELLLLKLSFKLLHFVLDLFLPISADHLDRAKALACFV